MTHAGALRVRPAVADDAPLLAGWAADMAWETEHKRLDSGRDPGHRRQGVFAVLYRHVREQALAVPDVLGLRLYVEQDNKAALRTYEALGMRDAGYRLLAETFERPAG